MWWDRFRDAADTPSDPGERAVRASAPADADAPEPDRADTTYVAFWRPPIRQRLRVVLAVLAVWAIAIQVRLVFLQVVHASEYAARAKDQQEEAIRPLGERGDIVDRHGRLLAYSVQGREIEAYPPAITDVPATIDKLCGALGDCTPGERRDLRAALAKGGWARVRRARDVTIEQATRVNALELPGIIVLPAAQRFYPQFHLAAQVIGFVGADLEGRSGIESRFDEVIRGREGLTLVQKDAHQRRVTAREEIAPQPGATVELTLDLDLQHIAERELRAGIQEHRAEAGTVVVMRPETGEILALANYPTFNPNIPGEFPADSWKNRAVQDVYEPGSTFKIVTAAAAIEEGVLRPSDPIDVSQGYIKLEGRRPIYDEHRYGVLTFEDVIVKSSNVGAIKAGFRIGADRFSRWMRRFGFGRGLMPHVAGESTGIVTPPGAIDESGLASMSMGYQVSVTPIQMAAAVSAIANGGQLMEPHLVRAIVKDGVREAIEPKALRRALEPQTAAVVTSIMEGVVERGTARTARLDRYRVAGKTGTAKKAIPGGYSETDRNSSFVGFLPSRRPELTILVVIDTPRSGQVYGGTVAAPIFKRIAEAAMRELGVPATVDPETPIVARSRPASAPAAPAPQVIRAAHAADGSMLMPDLRGLSAREATRVLTRMGLAARVRGAGVVAEQSPAAGTPVGEGAVGVVQLRRAVPPPAAGGGGSR
jgi:cell division protein FtsI (penicillin-binding protein 3)